VKWQWPYLPLIFYEREVRELPPGFRVRELATVVRAWGKVSTEVSEDAITFRVKPWSHSRGHLFAVVDSGRIDLRAVPTGQASIHLVLSFGKIISIALMMAIAVVIITSHWSYGLLAFVWLVGVNWVRAFFMAGRHFDALFEGCFGEH